MRPQHNETAWQHYSENQKFEHELINRKTTWLLTTQAILLAAYGIAVENPDGNDNTETFLTLLPISGMLIAIVVLIGVIALISAKYRSFLDYRKFAEESPAQALPEPLNTKAMQWGVSTANTRISLLPDVLLPIVFAATWLVLLLGNFTG